MFYAYKLLGSMIAPPGSLIIITVLFSFLLLRTKSKKMLFWSMILFSASIWVMSTSVGSYAMIGGLERKYENSAPVSERPIAFLVLAGGSNYDSKGREVMPAAYSLERIYTAVTSADPAKDVLIFSGGNVSCFTARAQAVLEQFDGREVLHATFGSVLECLGAQLKASLNRNEELYYTTLEAHFDRHLAAFNARLPSRRK